MYQLILPISPRILLALGLVDNGHCAIKVTLKNMGKYIALIHTIDMDPFKSIIQAGGGGGDVAIVYDKGVRLEVRDWIVSSRVAYVLHVILHELPGVPFTYIFWLKQNRVQDTYTQMHPKLWDVITHPYLKFNNYWANRR